VLRRRAEAPAGCWLLDGTWYGSERDYLAALAKRTDRRARVLARISAERGELLEAPGIPADAVAAYYRQLAPHCSAEHDGWVDDEIDDEATHGYTPPRPGR
jgi:hypothetical protein